MLTVIIGYEYVSMERLAYELRSIRNLPQICLNIWPELSRLTQPRPLHSRSLVHIADSIINSTAGQNKNIVVVTFSEVIFCRIQRRIVDKTIKPEEVEVYFCDYEDDGFKPSPRRITFDEGARPSGLLPSNYWMESIDDCRVIVKARHSIPDTRGLNW